MADQNGGASTNTSTSASQPEAEPDRAGPIREITRSPGRVRLINATGGLLQRLAVRWPDFDDPEDSRAFLGRARAFLLLGNWDKARADVGQAAAWNADWSGFGLSIVLTYARCLPAHPEQLGRVLALAHSVWASWRTQVVFHTLTGIALKPGPPSDELPADPFIR